MIPFRLNNKGLLVGSNLSSSGWTQPGGGDPGGLLWPKAHNTGVLPGVPRTNYGGGAPAAGTIIENRDVTGTIEIHNNNITIRNCKLQFNSWYGIIWYGGTNLLIEDCEIDCSGSSGMIGTALGNCTIRRCNIHGAVIATHIWGPIIYEYNYIHDLQTTNMNPDARHFDGVAMHGGSDVIIRNNAFVMPDPEGGTAAVFITTQNGSTSNVEVRNNLMLGNPSFPAYAENNNGNSMTNITYDGNYIRRGIFGYIQQSGQGLNATITNNVMWNPNTDPTPLPVVQWLAA